MIRLKGQEINAGMHAYDERLSFKEWKEEQAKALTNRGASPSDNEEENYIQTMLRHVMRAYTCHVEVDAYTRCLIEKKVVSAEHTLAESTVNMHMAEAKCPREVDKYERCLQDEERVEAVFATAIEQPRCYHQRMETLTCLERHKSSADEQDAFCRSGYRGLLRCGLNHMYDEYWKKISGFGQEEEVHLFEEAKVGKREKSLFELKEDLEQRYGIKL